MTKIVCGVGLFFHVNIIGGDIFRCLLSAGSWTPVLAFLEGVQDTSSACFSVLCTFGYTLPDRADWVRPDWVCVCARLGVCVRPDVIRCESLGIIKLLYKCV